MIPLLKWQSRKKMTIPSIDKNEELELSFADGGNAKWWNHVRNSLAVSLKKQKQNIYLPCAPAILFLGYICLREKEIYVYTENFTQMFIGTLVVIVKNGKQLKCPSISKWTTCDISIQWITI